MGVRITNSGLVLTPDYDMIETMLRYERHRHEGAMCINDFTELVPAKSKFIPQTRRSPKVRVLKGHKK